MILNCRIKLAVERVVCLVCACRLANAGCDSNLGDSFIQNILGSFGGYRVVADVVHSAEALNRTDLIKLAGIGYYTCLMGIYLKVISACAFSMGNKQSYVFRITSRLNGNSACGGRGGEVLGFSRKCSAWSERKGCTEIKRRRYQPYDTNDLCLDISGTMTGER